MVLEKEMKNNGYIKIASLILDEKITLFQDNVALIKGMVGVDKLLIDVQLKLPYISKYSSGVGTIYMYTEQEDIDSHLELYNKEVERLERNIEQITKKLNNNKFVENAPRDIVDMERQKLLDFNKRLEEQKLNIERVGR